MKEFNLLKIYLIIISIVGIIGGVIGYGNFAYQMIKYRLISAEEYVVGSNDNYQILQCDSTDPVSVKDGTAGAVEKKTPEEIAQCKEVAKKNMLARRAFDYKDSLISGGIWGTIFLLLFVTHFPVFFRRYREDEKRA